MELFQAECHCTDGGQWCFVITKLRFLVGNQEVRPWSSQKTNLNQNSKKNNSAEIFLRLDFSYKTLQFLS